MKRPDEWRSADWIDPAHGPPASEDPRVAVVIPSFRAAATIGAVLRAIGPEVKHIYVVDDGCPDATGERALKDHRDPRLIVLHNRRNLGVGGAMKRGYARALADGAEIIVKVDADGQMDPRHISRLIAPILEGRADYCKGNRFAPARLMPSGSSPSALKAMPPARRAGNMAFSVLHKAATGYWRIGDPANGYTAIHARALERIGLDALADCFFFETDMLFRLNLVDAVVADVPLPACYPGSGSSLRLRRVAPRFAVMTASRLVRRLRSKYFTGEWNPGSVKLAAALAMIAASAGLAGWHWLAAAKGGAAFGASAAALACLALGLALLAAAGLYDARRTAREPLSSRSSTC
ncbi:MAG: dolichol-phosphate mannosyltransferase [Sphingomonadales bacterium]|jgi:glycosyltransferase involved in cell wall biosynthesis|nr:dolichol-phosphate mannosyltransferase [Sphingomonadales bacterium]